MTKFTNPCPLEQALNEQYYNALEKEINKRILKEVFQKMKNIFKDAFFGKAYKTRDGRKVIYCGTFENDSLFNTKVVINTDVDQTSDYIDFRWYTQEGKSSIADSPDDIVSEWEESIDEGKLGELAYDICHNKIKGEQGFVDDDIYVLERGFKAGYNKALSK